ncbi:MAG TPA: FHA domain-containing protein, partial [Polyangia bacterium]
MLALLALFGPKQGLRIPLTGRLILGRGAGADLQLVDGKVSREHCRIDVGDRILVEDLGSQNGTYLNGGLIHEPAPLAEGDELAIGDTLLLVAGEDVALANARYGAGTLLVSPQGPTRALPPAIAPAAPVALRGLGSLAAALAAARDEEQAVVALLDAV